MTRPSPKIVAPVTPGTLAMCGPSVLTTISRLPSSESIRSAVELSPARISTSDTAFSSSGSADGAAPTRLPRCWIR